jgi:hypothetical protein
MKDQQSRIEVMRKTLSALLLAAGMVLTGNATVKADCIDIGKTTSAGSLSGEVCLDRAAGTIRISGIVTLPDGSTRTIEASANLKGRRGRPAPTTAAGTVTITNGTDVTTVNLTVTEGTMVMAIETFTGKVITLALP